MVRGSTLLGTFIPTRRITARDRTNLPIIGMSARECISSTYPWTLPPSILAKKLVVEYFFQSQLLIYNLFKYVIIVPITPYNVNDNTTNPHPRRSCAYPFKHNRVIRE